MSEKMPAKAVLISSVHDYRMKRRGSIQAIADALVRAGHDTHFMSVRFSPLSLIKKDPRSFLWARANREETHNGVRCYLWRTPFHPFTTGAGLSDGLTAPLHEAYAHWPNPSLDRFLGGAQVVIVESGLGAMLIERARRLNPEAKLIYLAADPLDTIGAHPHIQDTLERSRAHIDHVCLRSRGMAPGFQWARGMTYFLPPALHPPDFSAIGADPYGGGVNAVSLGSMLFDGSFFEHATKAFPQVRFHVIGCGRQLAEKENLRVYPEMAFRETLPFIAHAQLGVAPYRAGAKAEYISESSLKLLQYAYLGLPAVCPDFAAGGYPRRFSYRPGEAASISAAITRALEAGVAEARGGVLSWDEATARLLAPTEFSDTEIAPDSFGYRAVRAA